MARNHPSIAINDLFFTVHPVNLTCNPMGVCHAVGEELLILMVARLWGWVVGHRRYGISGALQRCAAYGTVTP